MRELMVERRGSVSDSGDLWVQLAVSKAEQLQPAPSTTSQYTVILHSLTYSHLSSTSHYISHQPTHTSHNKQTNKHFNYPPYDTVHRTNQHANKKLFMCSHQTITNPLPTIHLTGQDTSPHNTQRPKNTSHTTTQAPATSRSNTQQPNVFAQSKSNTRKATSWNALSA